jgi:hypothetical protein
MQDDSTNDFAVRLLGSPDKPTHAICEGCKQAKPIKEFKTMSTNAQAKAWGYNRAIEIVSKKCKLCRKPRKPIAELSIKELQNRIASGDIKGGAIGDLLMNDRRALIRGKKREGVQKRWRTVRAQAWTDLLDSSKREYNRIRKAKQTNPNPFFTAYHSALINVRAMFTLERKLGKLTADKGKEWWQHIPPQAQANLYTLWQAIPAEHKQLIKQPEVFKAKLKGEEA